LQTEQKLRRIGLPIHSYRATSTLTSTGNTVLRPWWAKDETSIWQSARLPTALLQDSRSVSLKQTDYQLHHPLTPIYLDVLTNRYQASATTTP